MHSLAIAPELELPTDTSPSQSSDLCGVPISAVQNSAGGHERNVLKWSDRTKLSVWLNSDDLRARAAKESNTLLATEATTALGFTVTAPNISSMLKELGIAKLKPEKPAPTTPPQDIDLIALHQQLYEKGVEIQKLKIAATSTLEVINLLKAHVIHCESILLHLGRGTVATEINMSALRALPTLMLRLPETTQAAD